MKNKWRRWTSMSPAFQPSDGLDLLYIDKNNNIVNGTRIAKDVNWHDRDMIIVAWRLTEVSKTDSNPNKHLGTRYWNWRNSKFWPIAASRPPNHKLPYFRIELWLQPDGEIKLEYFLPEPPAPPTKVNYTDRADEV